MTIKRLFAAIRKGIFVLTCRRECPHKRFTIISQNCFGGIVYHRLGLPFQSPTINSYLLGEDFCKLCERPRHYFAIDPVVADPNKYPGISFPVLEIDDIVIYCPHEVSGKAAKAAWVRRCKRVYFEKVIIIANTWDLLNEACVNRLLRVPFPKIIYSYGDVYPAEAPFFKLNPNKYLLDSKGIPSPNPIGVNDDGIGLFFEREHPLYETIGALLSSSSARCAADSLSSNASQRKP